MNEEPKRKKRFEIFLRNGETVNIVGDYGKIDTNVKRSIDIYKESGHHDKYFGKVFASFNLDGIAGYVIHDIEDEKGENDE